jgi:hypothetical protein
MPKISIQKNSIQAAMFKNHEPLTLSFSENIITVLREAAGNSIYARTLSLPRRAFHDIFDQNIATKGSGRGKHIVAFVA